MSRRVSTIPVKPLNALAVTGGDGVEPADAAGAAVGGAVFVGLLAQGCGGGAAHFGGHRAAAHAGGVGFEDADRAGDGLGGDAEPSDGAADGGGEEEVT